MHYRHLPQQACAPPLLLHHTYLSYTHCCHPHLHHYLLYRRSHHPNHYIPLLTGPLLLYNCPTGHSHMSALRADMHLYQYCRTAVNHLYIHILHPLYHHSRHQPIHHIAQPLMVCLLLHHRPYYCHQHYIQAHRFSHMHLNLHRRYCQDQSPHL